MAMSNMGGICGTTGGTGNGGIKSNGAIPNLAKGASRHRFRFAQLRGLQHPDLSRRMYKLIKSENNAISAVLTCGRERASIASQLSDWGEATGDESISEISDKIGIFMVEMAECEDAFADQLQKYRAVLKHIRNTESSVQPALELKNKVLEELHRLKSKDQPSNRIDQLEQELVRAEAQTLVAEAQLTNITRQKFKQAFGLYLNAVIERAEKQIILSKHAFRILSLLDDAPVVPGDRIAPFQRNEATQLIIKETEEDLLRWKNCRIDHPLTIPPHNYNPRDQISVLTPPRTDENTPKTTINGRTAHDGLTDITNRTALDI